MEDTLFEIIDERLNKKDSIETLEHLNKVEAAARELLNDYEKVLMRLGVSGTIVQSALREALLSLDNARTR